MFGDLFKSYIKEREGLSVLETEFGFVTYKFIGKECFLKDMCVSAEHRKSSKARELIEMLSEIACGAGCEFISANVFVADHGSSNTLLAALKIGFKVVRAENGALLIIKDLVEG